MSKKKPKWERMSINEIKNNKSVFNHMRSQFKKGVKVWPYLCGNELKWKEI